MAIKLQFNDDGLLGGYTDYALVGIGVVALVAFIFCIILAKSAARKESLERLRKSFSEREEENSNKIADLNRKIFALENRLREMQSEKKFPSAPQSSPSNVIQLNKNTVPVYAPPEPPKPSLEDKYMEFVREFNALAELTGHPLKTATAEFRQKYNVQSFICTNAEMRVKSPMPPAEFGDNPNGNYLAFEIESGIFAVVPKVKTYTANLHSDQAMGEVFSSNFAQGNTYSKIRVVKPAIFSGRWALETKGQLVLE
ncbi:MAG: hypothetical protein J5809_02395 [Selenomonadaceae bacterium]|nr:hypothetical protein [Selenomonadaceae bacterium]